ncbi:MAG: LysR family transcriptional regulator [Gammaproteobacteria bacterium]|nr:LysR family transcriptional regulator [Gammaproteobacteria bacterium]
MDRFADMQMLVSVVEAGSISAAAERLNLAKSAVSRRLAELEARLGVSLIHRTTRRLSLTDSGRAYYARCVAILADVEEAESAVSQAHGALRGTLKVALPLAFGLLHLAPLIQAFMTAHPDVRFELDFNDRQIDLMQEGFDLAIRIATLADSSLIARRLAPIRHLVCASPDYLTRHGIPQSAADLGQHACLAYSNVRDPGLWSFHGPDGESGQVRVPVRLAASSGEFLMRAAIAGEGLVLLPSFYVHEALRAGQLLPLLADHVWPELAAYAVYPPTRHLSSRVRAFIDFLANRLAGEPYWDRMD